MDRAKSTPDINKYSRGPAGETEDTLTERSPYSDAKPELPHNDSLELLKQSAFGLSLESLLPDKTAEISKKSKLDKKKYSVRSSTGKSKNQDGNDEDQANGSECNSSNSSRKNSASKAQSQSRRLSISDCQNPTIVPPSRDDQSINNNDKKGKSNSLPRQSLPSPRLLVHPSPPSSSDPLSIISPSQRNSQSHQEQNNQPKQELEQNQVQQQLELPLLEQQPKKPKRTLSLGTSTKYRVKRDNNTNRRSKNISNYANNSEYSSNSARDAHMKVSSGSTNTSETSEEAEENGESSTHRSSDNKKRKSDNFTQRNVISPESDHKSEKFGIKLKNHMKNSGGKNSESQQEKSMPSKISPRVTINTTTNTCDSNSTTGPVGNEIPHNPNPSPRIGSVREKRKSGKSNNKISGNTPELQAIHTAFSEFQMLVNSQLKLFLENTEEKHQKMSEEKAKLKLELQTKGWAIEILQAENDRLNEILTEKEVEVEKLRKENLRLLNTLSKKS